MPLYGRPGPGASTIKGRQITVLPPRDRLLPRTIPPLLGRHLQGHARALGLLPFAGPQPPHLCRRRKQVVEPAFGLDPAVFEHHDMIGMAQRGPPVRDDEAGPSILDSGALWAFWILD